MGSPLAFLPILLMLMGALAVGIVLLGLNALLGRKIRTKRKLSPFESGMPLLDGRPCRHRDRRERGRPGRRGGRLTCE